MEQEDGSNKKGLDLTFNKPLKRALAHALYLWTVCCHGLKSRLLITWPHDPHRREFDIVNDRPEEPILIRRMDTDLPKVMMPELGRTLI